MANNAWVFDFELSQSKAGNSTALSQLHIEDEDSNEEEEKQRFLLDPTQVIQFDDTFDSGDAGGSNHNDSIKMATPPRKSQSVDTEEEFEDFEQSPVFHSSKRKRPLRDQILLEQHAPSPPKRLLFSKQDSVDIFDSPGKNATGSSPGLSGESTKIDSQSTSVTSKATTTPISGDSTLILNSSPVAQAAKGDDIETNNLGTSRKRNPSSGEKRKKRYKKGGLAEMLEQAISKQHSDRVMASHLPPEIQFQKKMVRKAKVIKMNSSCGLTMLECRNYQGKFEVFELLLPLELAKMASVGCDVIVESPWNLVINNKDSQKETLMNPSKIEFMNVPERAHDRSRRLKKPVDTEILFEFKCNCLK